MQVLQRARPDVHMELSLGAELPLVGRAPVGAAPAWLDRRGALPRVLMAADALVLAGYALTVPTHFVAALAFWTLTVAGFAASGLYHLRLHLAVLDDLPALLSRSAVAAASVGLLMAYAQGTERVGALLVPAVAGVLAHLIVRGVAYRAVAAGRRRGRFRVRTVVVGSGELSRKLLELAQEPRYGIDVVDHVDDGGLASDLHVPLVARLARHDVQAVVIGDGERDARERETTHAVRRLGERAPALFTVDRLAEVGARAGDRIGPVPVRRVRLRPLVGPRWAVKRAVDVVCAGLALVLLAPLLAVIASAVCREVGRSVLFRQIRIGQDGRPFELLKFRSMLVATTESDVTWSIAGDGRIGPVGRFLRRSSLDELPQLINVLRGDMTLVGPRPERPHFVERFSVELPHYADRHRVPVGLTGLAQVNGLRGDSSIDDRARFDNLYIENHSLWLDTKVLLRTVGHVLVGSGS